MEAYCANHDRADVGSDVNIEVRCAGHDAYGRRHHPRQSEQHGSTKSDRRVEKRVRIMYDNSMQHCSQIEGNAKRRRNPEKLINSDTQICNQQLSTTPPCDHMKKCECEPKSRQRNKIAALVDANNIPILNEINTIVKRMWDLARSHQAWYQVLKASIDGPDNYYRCVSTQFVNGCHAVKSSFTYVLKKVYECYT